ncbi:MAG TPA: thioredoxin [Ktedonobacteraceae bacterium]|nr:thioredoxin [Ktedonobacteraceae bacterium]
MSVERVTAANFTERIEQYQGIALVDFWAPWCMPCHLVSPLLEKLAQQYEGKVRIVRLNIDEQPTMAARYQIASIPTVTIFRHGRLINTLLGVRTEHIYQQAIEAALRPVEAKAAKTSQGVQSVRAKLHSVTVFSTPTCPWCAQLKAYLRQHNIPFKDVDVSRDTKAAQDMVRRSGQMGVPQAWIDGKVVVGFDRRRVDALLGLTAA